MREGEVLHALRPPPPDLAPISMLIASVKNEGKIPVPLSKAGIRLERTGALMELHSNDIVEVQHPLFFPLVLPSRESFSVNIEPIMIRRMLGVLQAQPDDEFTMWVGERIGQQYFSQPMKASDFLVDGEPYQVAISFEQTITQQQIGGEEYFPEGIFPLEPLKDSPAE